MYKTAHTVLSVGIHGEWSHWSSIKTLVSNGTYVRGARGELIALPVLKDEQGLTCLFRHEEKISMCRVSNRVLAERIVYYWKHYFSKCITNCASFAHFVTTGDFKACCPDKWSLVLEHPMRSYRLDQKARVGDVLCLLYAYNKPSRSRKFERLRPGFLKCQKVRHDTGEFTEGVRLKKKISSPEDIRTLHEKLPMRDYHFMVCIGSHQGKPIWLSQLGFHKPETEDVSFVITVGNNDPYEEHVPVFTFIRHMK